MTDPDPPRLVVTNTDTELKRKRAEQDVDWTLRELAANLIRVVRGAGKPYDIAEHAQQFIEALMKYRDVTGDLAAMDRFSSMLSISRDLEWRRQLSDVELERLLAEERIVCGALQVAASRLVGQRTQEAAGESEFISGVNRLEQVRAEQQREWKRQEAEKTGPAARQAAKPTRPAKPKRRG